MWISLCHQCCPGPCSGWKSRGPMPPSCALHDPLETSSKYVGEHETRWGYLDYQVNSSAVVDSMRFSLVRNAEDDFLCTTPQMIPQATITHSSFVQAPGESRLVITPVSYNWYPLGRTWCSSWTSRVLGRADCAGLSVQHCTGQCWCGEEELPPSPIVLLFLVSNCSNKKSYLFLSALLRWFLDTEKVLYLHPSAF